MSTVRHVLSTGNFSQNWAGTAALLTAGSWANIASIVGYRGDALTAAPGTDPQTILADGSATPIDLLNASTTGSGTGGIHEISDDVVGLQGSGTADAPHLVFYLDATGRENITFAATIRELDAATVDQRIAIQYRVGGTGNFVNLPAGAVSGFAPAGNQSFTVNVTLPAAANNASQLEIRVITNDATGADAMIGIDDIVVSSSAPAVGPGVIAFAGGSTDVSVAEGNAGTTPITFTVGRTGGSTGAVSATWTVTLGTADAADFAGGQVFTGTVDFADGQTTATITLNLQGDTVGEGNETFSVALSSATGGATLGTAVNANGTITNDDVATTTIAEIQGAGHTSSFLGQSVITTGIVTAVDTNGFWIQMAVGDGNAQTSDGIFVFTSSAPPAAAVVGNAVQVTGTVTEFQSSAVTGLTVTQISTPTVVFQSASNPLPTAILFGTGGVNPPTSVYEDDNFATYDPATDAIDFYEQFEGMRVIVDAPQVVSTTNSFGETWVVASNGANVTGLSARGGITISAGDLNPERIQIDSDSGIFAGYTPEHTIGDRLASVNGIFNYAFDNYEVLVTSAVTVTTNVTLADETAAFQGDLTHITIATYNMENLDPGDNKYTIIANDIVFNLRAPDIIGAQEIQDADGAGTGTNLSGTATANGLIAALSTLGFNYAYVEVAPTVANSTGGEPGGNIRNGYFYRTDRVQYVANSAVLIEDAAYTNSRRPLVADFVFNGLTIQLVNMHSSSRIGSDPLFGDTQPPANAGATARTNQATAVRAYVNAELATDPALNIVVLGDLNGFYFENEQQVLTAGGVLTNLNSLLPSEERYSYLFDGNLQALDNILVTGGLLTGANFDAVHINAETTASASRPTDHDPQVAYLFLAPIFNGTAEDNSFTAPANVPYIIYGNDGNDTLTGNAQADVIFGGIGNDIIDGGLGSDSIAGGDGNDRITGGSGAANELQGGAGDDTYVISALGDTIVEATNGGTDTVETALTPYVLANNVENLTYTGAGVFIGVGNDLDNVVTGGTGSDALVGLGGNDRLITGTGAADELQGNLGDDIFTVQAAGTTIIEAVGAGFDSVETNLANYTLSDNVEGLSYSGNASFGGVGNALGNSITGNSGADTLVGLEGNDILAGIGGADLLIGGDGADTFVYFGIEGPSYDRILDFTSGSDRFELLRSGFMPTATIEFVSGAGATATSTNSTFLYDTNTGIVSFDADGTGAGAAIQLAQLNTGLTLSLSDFAIIG